MNYSKLSNITQKWVDILMPFSTNFIAKYTASQLEYITKIPQQTISRVLSEMVEISLLEYEIKGRNKYYYFNFEKISSNIIINIIEQKKAVDFVLNNPQIEVIIKDLLSCSNSIIIFGSYSAYTQTKYSDLDLIIIEGDNEEINKIKKKYNIEINIENINYKELNKFLKEKKTLILEVQKNHIIFGDLSKVTEIFIKNG